MATFKIPEYTKFIKLKKAIDKFIKTYEDEEDIHYRELRLAELLKKCIDKIEFHISEDAKGWIKVIASQLLTKGNVSLKL